MNSRFSRARSIGGSIVAPPDKSLTHRAYMLAAAATSPSRIMFPLKGEDCNATRRCLTAMGTVFLDNSDFVVVEPPQEWRSPIAGLDCGNSGTTMRLLAGMIASRPIEATLIGDASLSGRPMARVADPLRIMGAEITGEKPPLSIRGGDLTGIDYTTPVPSAQIKSAILLAGLRANGETIVRESILSRNHTENMLCALGVPISTSVDERGLLCSQISRSPYAGFEMHVPGDPSSAAFFMVAAAMLGGTLEVTGIAQNPTRTGFLHILSEIGASLFVKNERGEMGEPCADIVMTSDRNLAAFAIDERMVPSLIDEIPVLAVLATQCEGTSVIRGARELRVKESDRIETVAKGLRSMGASVETFEDGMAITGPTQLRGAKIDASGDHRIAMAFAIAALVAEGETEILGAESVHTSYPEFESELRRVCTF